MARSFLRPFQSLGVSLPDSAGEAEGDCPFCGKEAHFYVSANTGQWSCKRCGESGNIPTFLRALWERSYDSTKLADYRSLSRDRDVAAKTLKEWGVARSILADEWLIPAGFSDKGLANLYRCDERFVARSAAGCKLALFSLRGTPTDRQNTVWVCEGPWDAMAWHCTLSNIEKDGEPLSRTHAVIGLPGAGSRPKQVAKIGNGRHVRLLLDNDDAGRRGTEAIAKLFAKETPASLQAIRWGDDLPSGYDVRDLVKDKGPSEAFSFIESRLEPIAAAASPHRFHFRTFAELMADPAEINYLIEDVLCEDHPCCIIGPSKTLKTSIAIDMAISLATGGKFLNYFNCRRVPVALMSGESGVPTIKDTARRIADAYGFTPSDLEGFRVSHQLPQFNNEQHLAGIAAFLKETDTRVLIVDPAYLCIDANGRESSLFAMGNELRGIAEVCRACHATFVLLHHATQRLPVNKPPRLDDASWAGFSQFFRQWIGINRRTSYKPGTGRHQLLLTAGGAMGHSDLYHLDILEGTTNGNRTRRWEPEVFTRKAIKDNGKRKADSTAVLGRCKKIEDILRSTRKGLTQSDIAEHTRMSNGKCKEALERLRKKGGVTVHGVRRGNRRVNVYRLANKPQKSKQV